MMSDHRTNEGVEISGGTVNIGAMSVGPGSQVRDVTTHVTSAAVAGPASADAAETGEAEAAGEGGAAGAGTTEKGLETMLAELAERIEAERVTLPDPDEALRLVAELRDALQQTASGPERVRGLLARLVTSLRPVGELAAIAKAVSDGVRAVLG